MKLFIGIDPGKSGGIGFISQDGTAWAHKMPETDRDLLDLLGSCAEWDRQAVLEQVNSMPGQGVVSVWTFGLGYGALGMALVASDIPFQRVRPQMWQKALGCMTGGDKNVSKRKAQELFPLLKITHATADALLLAEYCRRTCYSPAGN